MAGRFRNLIDLHTIDLALGAEEQHVGMGGRHEQVLNEVVVLQVHTLHAFAAALLLAIGSDRETLDVACLRNRDDHLLVGDQIFDVQLFCLVGNTRFARRTELLLDLQHFLFDDFVHQAFVREDATVIVDALAQLSQLFFDLFAFQAREATQAHLKNGLCLLLGERKGAHQAIGCLFVRSRRTDDVDDLVDMVERNDIAFENMGARFGFCQVIARPAHDDVFLVLDVIVQRFFERKYARHAVDKRQHDNAEPYLQLRVLVKLVQHNLRNSVLLELDNDVDARAVCAVMDVRNFRQLLFAHQLRKLFKQLRAVDLVRNFRDHDGALAVLAFVHAAFRTHCQASATCLVRIHDTFTAHDDAASREIRTRHDAHKFLGSHRRIIQHQACCIDSFAQIMRRDIRCHTDGDTVATIDQQVRESRGKNDRFLQALVVVRLEINGLLIKVAQELHGRFVQASFGVAHSCSGVAVDRSKVAMAVNERNTHGKRLREAHHRIVDRQVTVRVVFADNVTDRTR